MLIVTPRISPFELIETDCLLPRVVTRMLAAKPAASTKTSIRPSPARPRRSPLMLRLASLQVPVTFPDCELVTSLLRSNL
jgi:hypothetical protein